MCSETRPNAKPENVTSNIMKHSAKILLYIFLVLIGCKNIEHEKEISNIEFEKIVFKQVFINIVDSTYRDKRIYTRIPIKGDEDNPDFIAETKAIERDTLGLIIAVDKRFEDVKKLNSKKFIFKSLNELPYNIELHNWEVKYKKFIGAMSFSQITFDKAKENGNLEVSYRCGGKCGLGYKVFLKKIHGKWRVIKKVETWIS